MKKLKKNHHLKYGDSRQEVAREVVRMRDREQLSWQEISYRLPEYTSVPTVYALYDEIKGSGAHHGRLPGRGGRLPRQ